jgi:hypothetical protein
MTLQEFEQMLHDAEVKLARLKALYEQWFQGIEKMEPAVARKDLDRTFELLKKNQPRNTAMRFRLQQLWARYGTYGIYWGRIARQIEDGTFKRDLVRVAKKQTKNDKRAADAAWELDVEIDEIEDEKTDPGLVVHTGKSNGASKSPPARGAFGDHDIDAILGTLGSTPPAASPTAAKPARPLSPFAMGARPAAAPAPLAASATFGKPKDRAPPASSVVAPLPTASAPIAAKPAPPMPTPMKPAIPSPPKPAVAAPPPKPAPSAGLDDAKMRALYSRYVDARKQNNERAEVRYEALAESVEKMMPKLREKHGNKAIDFDVVVSNGKVGLKPKVGP